MPLIDWTVLAGGVFLAFGAVAILALGHRRSQESGIMAEEPVAEEPAAEEPPIIHMQQIRHAQQQLRSVFDADARSGQPMDIDEGVRVRRV